MNEILTIAELASMLKLSKRTICNLMVDHTNPLPVLRIGRSVRFSVNDVQAWLTKQTENKAA